MANKYYDIVEIKWIDAQSGFGQAFPISDFDDSFEVAYTYTTGYLLREDKDRVIIGFMLFGEEGDMMVKHWQFIPKGMILNMKKITRRGK